MVKVGATIILFRLIIIKMIYLIGEDLDSFAEGHALF